MIRVKLDTEGPPKGVTMARLDRLGGLMTRLDRLEMTTARMDRLSMT